MAPDNPRVQYVQATSLLSTPEEWGGDPDRALALLQSAVATFSAGETQSATAPRWGHADAAAWLAMAHLMRGEVAPARTALETAERLDPRSSFVQMKLKPRLAQLEASGDEG